MENGDFMKQPYEIIEAKLQLAELTILLGQATREKWARLETMKDVLAKEESLLKEIAETSAVLQKMMLDRPKPEQSK
jgi:hypothetical protein